MVWILGHDSRVAITSLANEVKRKKLALTNEEQQERYKKYHPFMSLDPTLFKSRQELYFKITSLIANEQIIYQNEDLLRLVQDFLELKGEPLAGMLYEDILCKVYTDEDPQLFSQAVGYALSAIERLKIIHPDIYCHFEGLVDAIVPLWTTAGRRRAVSCFDGFGALFMSINPLHTECNELQWMFDIAHELGHQILLLYQLADRVIASSYDEPIWSSIRKTNRPAIGSLHAAVSMCYILEVLCQTFLKTSSPQERSFCEVRMREYIADQSLGIQALAPCTFTELGGQIAAEILASLQNIQLELGFKPILPIEWDIEEEKVLEESMDLEATT